MISQRKVQRSALVIPASVFFTSVVIFFPSTVLDRDRYVAAWFRAHVLAYAAITWCVVELVYDACRFMFGGTFFLQFPDGFAFARWVQASPC